MNTNSRLQQAPTPDTDGVEVNLFNLYAVMGLCTYTPSPQVKTVVTTAVHREAATILLVRNQSVTARPTCRLRCLSASLEWVATLIHLGFRILVYFALHRASAVVLATYSSM